MQAPVAAQTLRQAQATLANARAAQARSQELFDKGFIGQAALDDARKTGELADAQMLATQKQLEGTGITGSDRALAVADVAGARASAQAARARAGYAVITAPLDGTLIARSVEVGDVVQPGKVLMTLSPRGATQLVVRSTRRTSPCWPWVRARWSRPMLTPSNSSQPLSATSTPASTRPPARWK